MITSSRHFLPWTLGVAVDAGFRLADDFLAAVGFSVIASFEWDQCGDMIGYDMYSWYVPVMWMNDPPVMFWKLRLTTHRSCTIAQGCSMGPWHHRGGKVREGSQTPLERACDCNLNMCPMMSYDWLHRSCYSRIHQPLGLPNLIPLCSFKLSSISPLRVTGGDYCIAWALRMWWSESRSYTAAWKRIARGHARCVSTFRYRTSLRC